MADSLTPEKRSWNMSRIKSKNTTPEIYLRKLLFAGGYRYQIAPKAIPGHPDIYLKKYNTAIFVHGCYWHRHSGCKYAYTPKTRVDFWEKKFASNIERDKCVKNELVQKGIRQIVIWECTINSMMKDKTIETAILEEIKAFFLGNATGLEV